MQTSSHGAVMIGMAGAIGLGGCVSSGPREVKPSPPSGAWVEPGPFEVMSIRIYPLTRLDLNESGAPVLVVFLEMADRWGDSVKAVGDLSIRAFPARSIGVAGEQETWELSLFDEAVNASLYDPTSRTYRVELTGLPEWMQPDSGGSGSFRVEASFRTPVEGGDENRLRETFTVSWSETDRGS